MKTLNEKIFILFSELLKTLITETINPEPEFRTEISKYPLILQNKVNLEYFRDTDYIQLQSIVQMISTDTLRSCIVLLKNNDYKGAFELLCRTCFIEENTTKELLYKFEEGLYEPSEETTTPKDDLEKRVADLEKQVKELKEIIKKMGYTPVSNKNSKFSRENITEESVRNARVKIVLKSAGYENTYNSLEDLLEMENLSLEPTIKNGYKGLASVLKKKADTAKPEDTFVYIVLNGYRIDFLFCEE